MKGHTKPLGHMIITVPSYKCLTELFLTNMKTLVHILEPRLQPKLVNS